MKNKKGISLIVLIVTIIVIIILAAAVILTLSKNNPIESAREATFKEDVRAFQDELALSISKEYVEKQGQRDEKITTSNFDEIKKYIPSFTQKYDGKFVIENDKLVGTDVLTEKEVKWSQDLSVVASNKAPIDQGDWDDAATDEDCFIWNGNTIIGYNEEKLAGITNLRIPSKCTAIELEYTYQPDGIRELVSQIESVEIPATCVTLGKGAFCTFTSLKDVTILEGVTTIGDSAFEDCTSLTSITIPKSVTKIGNEAFCNCESLTSITIPEGVISVENGVFASCEKLISITIPESVTNIGNYAFSNCESLTSITIPESVRYIGDEAFHGSNLTNLTIPENVISIGDLAFGACNNLTSITVDKDNKVFDSRDNCNGIINTAENTLVAGCKNTNIPKSVTSIGAGAFYISNLTNITIPESVTSIGIGAFEGCHNLTSITIPNNVTSVEYGAFGACSNLTINCRAESQPSGWDSNWNPDNRPVNWGYTGE